MPGFDEKALFWDEDPRRVDLARKVADAIRSRLPLNAVGSALEYGAGTGLVGLFLKPEIGSLLLADRSEGMVQAASEKIRRLNLCDVSAKKLDLMNQDLPDQTFDLIFSSMALHHIEDIAGIFKKFFQLLNPGGFLALADLVTEDGGFHGAGFDGHLGFDPEDLKGLSEKTGFQNPETELIFSMTRKNERGEERQYPIFLLWAQKA